MIKEILGRDQLPALGDIPIFRAFPDEDNPASPGPTGRLHRKFANTTKRFPQAGHVSIPINHVIYGRSGNLKRFRQLFGQYLIVH
jgi:hypothetical protein